MPGTQASKKEDMKVKAWGGGVLRDGGGGEYGWGGRWRVGGEF